MHNCPRNDFQSGALMMAHLFAGDYGQYAQIRDEYLRSQPKGVDITDVSEFIEHHIAALEHLQAALEGTAHDHFSAQVLNAWRERLEFLIDWLRLP